MTVIGVLFLLVLGYPIFMWFALWFWFWFLFDRITIEHLNIFILCSIILWIFGLLLLTWLLRGN